jgi:sec-independent protein translocase protein TatA
MDIFSPTHLFLILLLVVLLFGTSKLRNVGSDLGNAMRGFKKAFHGDEEDEKSKQADGGEKLQADPPASASTPHEERRDSTESKHESV